MKGFFEVTPDKFQIKSGQRKGISCAACGLYSDAKSPRMKPYGEFQKGIMVIGDSPDQKDDASGKPWQGSAGRFLRKEYARHGIDLYKDCLSLNSINCYMGKKGGKKSSHAISCCRPSIFRQIKTHSPKVIILHGESALTSIIGAKWNKGLGGLSKWRGWAIPDGELGAWICPTFHPSTILRQEEKSEMDILWDQDLKQAFSKVGEAFPYPGNPEDSIVITDDIPGVLKEMRDSPLIAFDIETTGLKPYNVSQHKIVSISFCNSPDKAYAMPFPTEKRHLQQLKELLEDPGIKKIAANMKYEDTWLNILHDIEVSSWWFDTMQAAHILDNRPGITGLKFQSYVNFGVLGYEDDVNPFLQTQDSFGTNRIMELVNNKSGFRKLLLYNGLDSLLEFRLALKQMKEIGIKF